MQNGRYTLIARGFVPGVHRLANRESRRFGGQNLRVRQIRNPRCYQHPAWLQWFSGSCNICLHWVLVLEAGADTVLNFQFSQGVVIDHSIQYRVSLSFKLPPDFKRGTTIRSNYFRFEPEE